MTARIGRRASGARHLRWGRDVHAAVLAHVEVDAGLPAELRYLTDAQVATLRAEAATLDALLGALATAVAAYRELVERGRVAPRAQQRVADFLVDQGMAAAAGLERHRATIDAAVPGGWAAMFARLPLSRVLRAGRKRTVRIAQDAARILRAAPTVPEAAPLATKLDTFAGLLARFVAHEETEIEPRQRDAKAAVERAVAALREGLTRMDGRLVQQFAVEFVESLYPELSVGGAAVADEADEDDDTTDPPAAGDPRG